MDWIPRVTVFHCINASKELEFLNTHYGQQFEIRPVKMPCSGMTKEVYLLKAFESGADAVVVWMCPQGNCRFLEGNTRATRRIERTKRLLDAIGLKGDRLCAVSPESGDKVEVVRTILGIVSKLRELGPNPAARPVPGNGFTPGFDDAPQPELEPTYVEITDDCRRTEAVRGNQTARIAL